MSTGPRGGPPVPSMSVAPRMAIVLYGPKPSPEARFGAGFSGSRCSAAAGEFCVGVCARVARPDASATRQRTDRAIDSLTRRVWNIGDLLIADPKGPHDEWNCLPTRVL